MRNASATVYRASIFRRRKGECGNTVFQCNFPLWTSAKRAIEDRAPASGWRELPVSDSHRGTSAFVGEETGPTDILTATITVHPADDAAPVYEGHRGTSGVQNHSCGALFPYIVYAQQYGDQLAWKVMRGSWVSATSFPSYEMACFHAAERLGHHQQRAA